MCTDISVHKVYIQYNINCYVHLRYLDFYEVRSSVSAFNIFFYSNHCLSEPDVIGINDANNRPD